MALECSRGRRARSRSRAPHAAGAVFTASGGSAAGGATVIASAAPHAEQAQNRSDEAGPVKLSTSQLAARLGLRSAGQRLERLTTAGYLEVVDGKHTITDKGLAAGGEFIEKSRYGPYFVWPEGLEV